MSDTFTPETAARLPHQQQCGHYLNQQYTTACTCARGAALTHIAELEQRIEELEHDLMEQIKKAAHYGVSLAGEELENARLTAELREARERLTQELSAQKMPSQLREERDDG